ncbi:hypothetical protein TPL01_12410 [Sulfuriferula plumbiphila]|uniref:Uncharacterized protein n=1 Tax=Sulfuriferula plumbiphila TaxID=171865 RepID=A0A512L6J2_9PROT|nr:hypothetical protein [Sulfuriferula plumbiphila]BBP04830.1 hypothetical protein SFPGR_22520 [Sulfuriferula plumbiphila]GEP30103.1 hypothetical protein TPL01_12410 [Sulfuriferula plumbiphila]
MLTGGGRLENLRALQGDTARANLLKQDTLPSTDAISGRLDVPTQKAIAEIPASAWKHYADCAVVETRHSMNGTSMAFRLMVVKYKRTAELFGHAPK